jgi:hypothetical protein
LLWLPTTTIFAQTEESNEGNPQKATYIQQLSTDNRKIVLQKFDAVSIQKYKQDPTFVYDRAVPKDLSWWDKFKTWLFFKLLEIGFDSQQRGYAKFIIYTLSALIITWASIKILGMDIFTLFSFTPQKKYVQGEWTEDNIHSINFDKEIADAINKKQYRVAVRLFYLFTLKKLTDKALIAWEINKTNHDYSLELAKTPKGKMLQEDFDKGTYYFEYVWYGDFKVNEEQFAEAQLLYTKIMKKI